MNYSQSKVLSIFLAAPVTCIAMLVTTNTIDFCKNLSTTMSDLAQASNDLAGVAKDTHEVTQHIAKQVGPNGENAPKVTGEIAAALVQALNRDDGEKQGQ